MLTVIPVPSTRRGRLRPRQPYSELGEDALFTVDLDRSAVLLGDDVVADREPQPGTLAGRLGGEERLEQLVADLGRNAGAVVAHPNLDPFAVAARRHRQ